MLLFLKSNSNTCLVIFFLCLMQESTSSYEWRCSHLDTSNNKYYLPNFGGRTQVVGYTWLQSINGGTYIYDVNENTLNCRGTVTAVEFCYSGTTNDRQREVFTLHTIAKQNDGTITVTNSIPVRFSTSSQCYASSRCCDTMPLEQQDQFSLPESNFLLGMSTRANPNLPGLFTSLQSSYSTQSHLISGQPTINTVLTGRVTQSLRLMWLHITPVIVTDQPISSASVPLTRPATVPLTRPTTPASVPLTGLTTSASVPLTRPTTPVSVPLTRPTTPVSVPLTRPTTPALETPTINSTTNQTTSTSNGLSSTNSFSSMSKSMPSSTTFQTTTSSNTVHSRNTFISPKTSTSLSSLDVISSTLQGGSSSSAGNGGIIGGVVVLVIILIIIIAVFVLILLFMMKYSKKLKSSKMEKSGALSNITCYHTNSEFNNVGKTSEAKFIEESTLSNLEYNDTKGKWKRAEAGDIETTSATSDIEHHIYYSPDSLEDIKTCPHEYELVEYHTDNTSPIHNNAEYEPVEYHIENTSPLQNNAEFEDPYRVPSNNVIGLYQQLNTMVENISRNNVVFGDHLGSGQFGDVYNGMWECKHDKLNVAVKILRKSSSETEKLKFLQEAMIMAQFRHPNVVTMYGVVKDREPLFIVLELLCKGDLKKYLFSMRTDDGGVSPEIDGHELLSYCRQVASGMVYLSNKGFVHRDLAARNILVSDDRICKIADFGMSRDLSNENYYVSQGGRIPIKWTAPEALFYKKYSTASDVWSFGAVMYEIWSIGHKPFESMQNTQVIRMLNSGYRLSPPPGCSRAIYNIMMLCWHPEASKRPNFNELSTKLSLSNSIILLVDKAEISEDFKLGADLSHGEDIFENLQKMYHTSSVTLD